MDLILPLVIINAVFMILAGVMIWQGTWRGSRSKKEWMIDAAGLVHQGLVVSLLQALVLVPLLAWLMPQHKGSMALSPLWSFLLAFAGVDYLYYWNHRLLHLPVFWKWHALHHSTEKLDFLATSRNSLLTPFLIVYLWAGALGIFLLQDPMWFMIAGAMGAGLDLWRHSGLHSSGPVYRWAGLVLTLPKDHSWHHSTEEHGRNFSANLVIWDQIHGTCYRPHHTPSRMGAGGESVSWRRFFWPRAKS